MEKGNHTLARTTGRATVPDAITPRRPGQATYTGFGISEPSDPTGGHQDHIHVSTNY